MTQTEFPGIFPEMETERLLLREIRGEDAQAIFRNFSDPEVARWFLKQPLTKIEQTAEFIEQFNSDFQEGKGLTWAVTLKETGEFIGTCGYGRLEIGACGDIGYDLAKEHWGKGVMSEALAAILDYGFSVLKLSRVTADTDLDNSRSRRLLERLGFHLDKVQEDGRYYSLDVNSRGTPAT